MTTTRNISRSSLAFLLTLCAIGTLRGQSIWNATNNLSANTNWSSVVNWQPNGVPDVTSNVRFLDNAAEAAPGTVNNVVDATTTVGSLSYANTNGFHTTLIAPGATLTNVGNLMAGTETDNGGIVLLGTASITGAGGRLVLSNSAANLIVRQGANGVTGSGFTLDLSGLDTFLATVGRIQIGDAGINRSTGILLLGKTNQITASGTSPAISVGLSGSNNGAGRPTTLSLGQTNAIFADSIAVGRQKQTAVSMVFNNAFPGAVAFFRGQDGVARVSTWTIGDGENNSGTTSCNGTCDFTGGTVDAQVTTLTVGRASSNTGGTGNSRGTLTLVDGTIDANTLQIGLQTASTGKNGAGTVNVNGGKLIVNTAIEMARVTGGAGVATTTGTLNINGGTVIANLITNGGSTATISITGGTLVSTNLTGFIGNTAVPINNFTINDATLNVAGTSSRINAGTLTAGGSTNTINIASVPVILGYPIQFTFIKYANPAGDLNLLGLGSLPVGSPSYAGYISNNTANSSIDLVLTAGPIPTTLLQWSGAADANWNTTSLNWLNAGVPVLYQDGQPVQLDDTATGSTTVNLTAAFAPAALTATNSAKSYTLTGPGRITGGGGLTKASDGTLIIDNSGNNDFAGNITITGGTVQVGSGGTNGNLPPSSITDNGTLTFNRGDNVTVNNTISGTGSVTKLGGGALTLTASSSYSGPTIVNAGTLVANGALTGGGVLTNAAGTLLSGSGSSSGLIDLSGQLNPGNINVPGTFFPNNGLTLRSGATLKADLKSDFTAGSGSNDLVEVTGDLNLNNNTVILNFLELPQIGAPYRLIDYSGTKNGNLNPAAAGTHYTAAIDESIPNQISVTITGSGANLKWNSTSSGVWDNGSPANWFNLGTSAADVFYAGDTVLLDDSVAGVQTTVTLGAGVAVAPTVITNISSANNFTFAGAGKISGAGGIMKDGTSTLTVSNANDFAGPVDIYGGKFLAGSTAALGTGAGITTIYPGATLDVNGLNLTTEPVTVSGDGVGGNGAIVNSGLQQISALRQVTLAGDTTFGGGSTLTNAAAGRWDIRNTGGAASLNTGGNPYKLTKVGTNQLSLVAVTVDGGLGDIDIKEGVFAIQTTTVSLSGGTLGNPANTITVRSNAQLNFFRVPNPMDKVILVKAGGTIWSENDSNVLSGPVTLESGSATFNVQNGGTIPNLVFLGNIDGAGNLLKIGASPLYFYGNNSYAGTTTISNGTLFIEGANAGVGATTVYGTLGGIGGIGGPVAIAVGGTLSPGDPVTPASTLAISNSLSLAGNCLMQVSKSGGIFTTDLVTNVTALSYGGTLQFNLSGDPLVVGDTFQLFSFNSASGAFTSITPAPGPGLDWDNSKLTVNGTIRVVSRPRITGLNVVAGQVVITGTNGVASSSYNVLTSTNVALPLANWTLLGSSSFDAGGNFSFTNGTPTEAQQFYLLQVP
jgi:autotransporter-associated beta strand protein